MQVVRSGVLDRARGGGRMKGMRIGEVTRRLGISADTLRYYERLGLLPGVPRTAGGARLYREQDLSRLGFIQRAKAMNFSLEEIAQLLEMRDDPQHARDEVRRLTRDKLASVEAQLERLDLLRRELTLLLNLCCQSEAGCPILEGIDGHDPDAPER
ncbi:MAG TPA: MerR family transcriptional regulator [Gammaproteobacteria bacterium]|nr:MerR family transcriptional regulator [Gammaproteobacteria bacterium]